jgi:TonB dependent receptor-like, beta-barrel
MTLAMWCRPNGRTISFLVPPVPNWASVTPGPAAASPHRTGVSTCELVYVGDEGTTESSGRTRRIGVELEGRTRVQRWLWVDGDLALSRGRFRDAPAGENRIPLAPTVTANGGLTVRDLGPASGGIRVRYLGARPADEANTIRAREYTLLELFGAYELGPVRLFGAVDNLLNVSWNEAQFATMSRLLSESRPVTDLDFTPGSGRALQLGVGYRF